MLKKLYNGNYSMGKSKTDWSKATAFDFKGSRIGILLLHGFTGSPQSVRPWGAFLAKAGYTVSCPLLPGHGTSWRAMNKTRWQDWYETAVMDFENLQKECDQVFVMGLSMGATLALKLAEDYPDQVSGLVLVNPSVTTLDWRAKLAPIVKWFKPSIPGISNDIKKTDAHELAYDRLPLKAFDSLRHLWGTTRTQLINITAPLLLYHSPEDHTVEPINSEIILKGVSSSIKQEVLCENSYHVATLDNDADKIFQGSLAFIRVHKIK